MHRYAKRCKNNTPSTLNEYEYDILHIKCKLETFPKRAHHYFHVANLFHLHI